MVSTTHTKSSGEAVESLLSDENTHVDSLARKAVTPEIITASELSRDELREVADESLSSALLGGSEQAISDFMETLARQEVQEKTLRLLLAEIQVLLADMASERASVSTQAVQRTTSRAIAQISSAYKKERVTATEGTSRNTKKRARRPRASRSGQQKLSL